jgi:serine/threonine protein kinase
MALPAPRGLEAIGPYRILEDLGAAPWGTVYRALDTRRDLPVLLKVVPASLRSGELEGTAWDEALAATAALGRLYHRNLPSVAEVAEDEEEALLVAFSPVEGRTLRELVAAGELPDRARFAAWCEQLADALAEAHAHGLRHGRISAEEVVVTADGEPVLTGFGLTSLAFEPAAARPRLASSAPSPDPAQADVTALGTLLLRLAQALPGAPLAPGDPLRRALERAASSGPRTAAELAEAVRQARRPAGEAVPDLPAAAEAQARGDRRSALLLLAAALLLALLVLGAGWLLVRGGPRAAAGTTSIAPAPVRALSPPAH